MTRVEPESLHTAPPVDETTISPYVQGMLDTDNSAHRLGIVAVWPAPAVLWPDRRSFPT